MRRATSRSPAASSSSAANFESLESEGTCGGNSRFASGQATESSSDEAQDNEVRLNVDVETEESVDVQMEDFLGTDKSVAATRASTSGCATGGALAGTAASFGNHHRFPSR